MNKFFDEDYSFSSILSDDVSHLIEMDLDELKRGFLEEIKSLKHTNEIISRLLDIEYDSKSDNFDHEKDHRLFMDLLSIPELKDISYFREVISEYDSFCEKLFRYYDVHSKEERDKFNYILKSSFEIYKTIRNKDLDLEFYFSSRVMSLFDKESLGQLYRAYLRHENNLKRLNFVLEEDNHKILYLLSIIMMKFKLETGHNSEIMDRVLMFVDRNRVYKLLSDIYDCHVGDSSKENEFRDKFVNEDCCWEIHELVRSILDNSYSGRLDNLNSFRNYYDKKNEKYHYCVLKKGTLSKIENGSFDIDNDFKEIDYGVLLDDFKNAFFYRIYGISLIEAKSFVNCYGVYIKELEESIMDSDNDILNILKTFKYICEIDCCDSEKIRELQLVYYDFLTKNGTSNNKKFTSTLVLESLFNRMIINTYNKKLLCSDELSLIGVRDGVKVLDAGVNFNILLTCLGGVSDIYTDEISMKRRWNTAINSYNHGLCCSYINNENLGVIGADSVILGFDNVKEYSLNKMGSTDIFSKPNLYDLKHYRASEVWCNRFYPINVLANETRYGYNELLLDRYLLDDEDDIYKVQPSYVVFYKYGDNYENEELFEKSLKTAKDFGIPIVVIDFLKVKAYEKEIIFSKEEELFSSNHCDSSLMKEIIIRYMNNYSGSYHFIDSNNYEDFSERGLEEFFDRLFLKLKEMGNSPLRKEWIDSLSEIYDDESRKHEEAMGIYSHVYNINSFLLANYRIKQRINNLDKDDRYEDKFINKSEFTDDVRVLINFIGVLDDNPSFSLLKEIDEGYIVKCNKRRWLDAEDALIKELVVSYFFEDCDHMLIDDLLSYNFKNKFNFTCSDDFDFISSVRNSYIYSETFKEFYNRDNPIFDIKKLDKILDKINKIPDYDFLKIFEPVLSSSKDYENKCSILLEKKKKIGDSFFGLQFYKDNSIKK